MSEIIAVVLDLAKRVLHVREADAAGQAVLRTASTAGFYLFNKLPVYIAAMKACGVAHFRGREAGLTAT